MSAWVHRRLRQEEGISLIEMLVSILLVGLTLSALGSTLLTSMASARQSEGLTTGVAIAAEQIEKLQTLPWSAVGFYDTDPNYATPRTVGGQSLPTVRLGSTPPSPRLALLPREVRPVGTRQYTITRDIVWKTSPRYKWFRVRVSWNEGAATKQTVLEGRRARRPSDSGAGILEEPPFRIRSFTVTPDPVLLSSTGRTQASTTPALESGAALLIEVTTTRPAAAGTVIVTYEPSKSVTLTAVADSGGLEWRALVQPDAASVYYTKLITFTANAREVTTNVAAPADTTAAMFLRQYVETKSYVFETGSPSRELLYPSTPSGGANDRFCVSQSGNAANLKPLNADTWLYFGLGGLEAPDLAAATPGDTVTLTRLDAGQAYTLTLQHFVYQGTEYWRGMLPSSGSGRPVFLQDTVSRWRLSWSRSYDALTPPARAVNFYIDATNSTC